MSAYNTVLATLTEHQAHVGPVSGAWVCTCGAESTNGAIKTGDLTSRADRAAQWREHLADALTGGAA